MAWDKTFPQSSTIISASPPQFQANWDYIEDTLKVDHFYADTTTANDGRHNVVQMPSQAVEPTIGTNMRGAFYVASQGSQDIPRYKNTFAFNIPYGQTGNTALPANTTPITIIDFNSPLRPNVFGHFMMFDTTITGRFAQCVFKWRAGSLTIAFEQTVGSTWTTLQVDGGGTAIQLVNTSTSLRNAAWQYIGYATP